MRPLVWLYSLYAMVVFIVIMLLIFPFVIIASFFGRIKGGNAILWLCRCWADLWFPLIGIYHKRIYEAPHDKTTPYIFVSNHISYLDSAVLVKAYRQPLRPLGKVEMSKIPVFGFIYRNAIVTVDRSSAANRANSIRVLRSILGKGISVLVFPEGTFNDTHKPLKDFYDGAFRLAIETQTPIKPVLFLDTYARMPYTGVFTMTPGKSRIVYMEEISVAGLQTEDLPALKQQVYSLMEQKLMAYKADWIR
ncbi:1-acyl-sn-glycerol-3-phosphate acyltransferase [Terrimonas sp. NA20]|uniref:1-acyl-sn-glycerol-3-phosphate acyltransferase n=1 Tax=Terrimonas ginsenosidimutans TaxID=2908004 RepID=A0ABS9KZN1_9BACT|nr:lysophospholipid acyltransferase family protein [Terrimonas ginsenosidimutans]MCG2617761.1 1-acyl-sn-glycerol-3-phosphate acyltransferase [Terrimonas ginsenosidimutans]